MKRERKFILEQLRKLSEELDVELDNSNTDKWDAERVNMLINQHRELNSKLHPNRKNVDAVEEWQCNPALVEIYEKYNETHIVGVSGTSIYSCPKCGDADHRNMMNGKPYCFKCNCLLTKQTRQTIAAKSTFQIPMIGVGQ